MQPTPVVYLLVSLRFSYGREIVRGVRECIQSDRLWQLAVLEPTVRSLRSLQRDPPDGLIGLFSTPALEDAAKALKIPTVNVSTWCDGRRFPGVVPDTSAVGKMAAEHFLSRGFRHFAFAGDEDQFFARARHKAFVEALRQAGHSCTYLPDGRDARSVRTLPTPVGIMACSDIRARRILTACIRARLRVPQDAALIGVDNDEAMCETAEVPLTSVDPNARRIGFEGAGMLAKLMSEGRAEQRLIRIAPAGLIVRSSSDAVAVPDEEVATAMRYMRAHACDPMRVEDMLGSLKVSRRTLEKRFRTIIGRTLHDEIRRLQFEKARQLLSDTDLNIPQVASRCGFRDPKRFTTLFREEFGSPPVAFRREARTAAAANAN